MSLKDLKLEDILKYVVVITITILITKYLSPKTVLPGTVHYDTVTTYRDISNKIHSVISHNEQINEGQKHLIDSLSTVLKVKSSNIKTVTSVITKIDTVFTERTIVSDSTFTIGRKDKWVSILAKVNKDSGTISFNINDTLTMTSIEKNSLFKSTSYIDIYHSNPYIRDTKGYSFSVTKKSAKVSIGPYIGYGYDIRSNTLSPSIGISIQLPLIKIK